MKARLLTVVMLLAALPAAAQQHWLTLPKEYLRITPKADTVTIYALGDIMSHQAVSKSAGEHGFSSFFKYIEDRIREADVAVGNMEFPLAGKPYTGYPAFSGPDSYADYLWDIGLDVFLTANNHILDKGSAGLTRTIRQLEDRGILYTGIAADERADTLLNPLVISTKGLRIAIVNFTYGTNLGSGQAWPKVHYMRKEALAPVMERARRKADLVLVFPHWGVEYDRIHSARQEEMARWLIQEGADAIIGAHPHVVQDTQVIDGVPVIYSLGNALSNQNDLAARLEAALTLKAVVRWGEEPTLEAPRLELLWCTKPGMVEPSYATVPVTLPESCWKDAGDYRHMKETLERL